MLLVRMFNGCQFRQALFVSLLGLIRVVVRISDVGGLWTKEKHKDELKATEYLEHVEQPQPAEALEDLAADDGRQTGCRVQDEVDDRNAETSLMDEVHVADRRYDQRLECRS